jgi:RNA polymerase sigma-70 factor, ECF subfamily
MERLRAGNNTKGWLFTILRNVWLNQLRKWRKGPQMVEIEVGDAVADRIVEPSKDSHDLYVSKLEAGQVRAANRLTGFLPDQQSLATGCSPPWQWRQHEH